MSNQPLLSIVVPTYNRQKYAKSSVRSLSASIAGDDIEFVFQDASDDTSLGDFIRAEIHDPRVRYDHASGSVNMTQNFNLAMARATGQYVCLIGDDDGVNPEIIDAARWAKANEVDSLTPVSAANYMWPDFRSRYYGDRHAGKVYLKQFSGRFSRLDLSSALLRCVHGAALGLEQWGMPKVYLGMTLKDRLETVRIRTGSYFGGISPDMYASIVAAQFCRKAYLVDYPLIMGGASGGSNAGLAARRQHRGTFEEAAHMRGYSVADWPKGAPKYWTTETAYSTSALLALRDLGRDDLIQEFNYTLLHAACLFAHPDYRAETLRSFWSAPGISNPRRLRSGVQLAGCAILEASSWMGRLGRRLLSPGPAEGARVCANLHDIQAGVEGLVGLLKSASASFRDCVAPDRITSEQNRETGGENEI